MSKATGDGTTEVVPFPEKRDQGTEQLLCHLFR